MECHLVQLCSGLALRVDGPHHAHPVDHVGVSLIGSSVLAIGALSSSQPNPGVIFGLVGLTVRPYIPAMLCICVLRARTQQTRNMDSERE